MIITDIEEAIQTVREFRYSMNRYNIDARELYELIASDTMLINAVIAVENYVEGSPDDFDNGKFDTWLRMQKLIFKTIEVPFTKWSSEILQTIGQYFQALLYLAEIDIDEAEIGLE